jgi:hypothetical protein
MAVKAGICPKCIGGSLQIEYTRMTVSGMNGV